jgi:methionine-S-sulfoxide reductase
MSSLSVAGCFWSVELIYQREPGVLKTEVGYIGGHKENPTYKETCTGTTGHAEAVRVEFDPKVVSYSKLLDIFWHSQYLSDERPAETQLSGSTILTPICCCCCCCPCSRA